MESGTVHELSLDLRPVAHTFEEGHQLALQVTSSNFLRFDRNPNRAMDVDSAIADHMQTTTNTIHHHADRQSNVSLPVLEEYTPAEPRDNYGAGEDTDEGTETTSQTDDGPSDETTQSNDDEEAAGETGSSLPGWGLGTALTGLGGAVYLMKNRLQRMQRAKSDVLLNPNTPRRG